MKLILDNAGNERELELVGTFRDGVELYRETGGTGVVADNADGIRLFHDAETYVDALPEWDRAEAAELLAVGFSNGRIYVSPFDLVGVEDPKRRTALSATEAGR